MMGYIWLRQVTVSEGLHLASPGYIKVDVGWLRSSQCLNKIDLI